MLHQNTGIEFGKEVDEVRKENARLRADLAAANAAKEEAEKLVVRYVQNIEKLRNTRGDMFESVLLRAEEAERKLHEEQQRGSMICMDWGITVDKLTAETDALREEVDAIKNAQYWSTPKILDPDADGQTYITLGEYIDRIELRRRAGIDAALRGLKGKK
jgi:small-conductance mechanosensitive channel